jgi:hypothetical protein
MSFCPLSYCNDSQCPRKAACLSEKRKMQSRAIASQATVIRQKKLDNNQEFKGEYLGRNASTGNAIVSTPNGVIQAKSITTGYLVPGRLVTGIIPYKGAVGIISNMPN